MEDTEIIELFFRRDQQAITETKEKYGAFCLKMAKNISGTEEDAQECLNTVLYTAWEKIPPARPEKLGAWLGRVVRNTALSLYRKNHAEKRYCGIPQLLEELSEMIPDSRTVESETDEKVLSEVINNWLLSLNKADRILFVRRYWHGIPLKELARERKISPNKLAQEMLKLRNSLKDYLKKEGVNV